MKGRLLGDDCIIEGVSSLYDAMPSDLSFVIWPQDFRLAKKTRAGVMVTDLAFAADYAHQVSSSLIVVESLYDAFHVVKQAFLPPQCYARLIHPTAMVHQSAVIGDACIKARAVIGPLVVIKDGSSVGEDSHVDAGAVIHENVVIKDRCYIGANSVIGGDGFVPYGEGETKILLSLGSVVIESDVRIGNLCTVDRGLVSKTTIGRHTLIDNMVHIGHDVVVGEQVVIAGQTGLAGFVRLADQVTLGGQVGIKPFVQVGTNARISGKSLVHCDIKNHEIWSGNPSVPHAMYLRSYGKLKRTFKDMRR